MVILLRNIVSYAETNSQGEQLYRFLIDALSNEGVVTVDFTGVSNVTSSFVNSSFVEILGGYSIDEIRRRIRIVGANRQISEMIKSRLYFEAA